MIQFISFYVTLKYDYLYSIHLHSFPFLYFKISKQGYLMSFHSFSLLKYIPFHSFPFLYDHSISFPYELPNEAVTFPPITNFVS